MLNQMEEVNRILENYAKEIGAEYRPATETAQGHLKIGNMIFPFTARPEGAIVGTKAPVDYDSLEKLVPIMEAQIAASTG